MTIATIIACICLAAIAWLLKPYIKAILIVGAIVLAFAIGSYTGFQVSDKTYTLRHPSSMLGEHPKFGLNTWEQAWETGEQIIEDLFGETKETLTK